MACLSNLKRSEGIDIFEDAMIFEPDEKVEAEGVEVDGHILRGLCNIYKTAYCRERSYYFSDVALAVSAGSYLENNLSIIIDGEAQE